MHVRSAVPLAPYTTLRLGGPAERFAEATTDDDVRDASNEARRRGEPCTILGGGSNVVIADAGVPGLVVRLATRGIEVARDGEGVVVDVRAGEPWDDFVGLAVDEGWSGIEALAGIPGLVGATPIQNVGAYGQEIEHVLVAVRALVRATGEEVELPAAACALRYRGSRFKDDEAHVILSARFRLQPSAESVAIRYGELARALGVAEGATAPLARVREAVLDLRRGKGMVVDPADGESMSAGSFFTNPIVPATALPDLAARLRLAGALAEGESVPTFAAGLGRVKVPAAWLVERAGFRKGHGSGAVGVSRKHSLALVHRGGGTSAQLLALAAEIRDGVLRASGVRLRPEPVFLGTFEPGTSRASFAANEDAASDLC